MNRGIEELRKHADEFERKQLEENFKKSVARTLLTPHDLNHLKIKEYDMPYVTIRMSFDDFKRTVRRVGTRPNWDLNWGEDFYCIKARFDWDNGTVTCVFQCEAEWYNKPKFLGRVLSIHELGL